MKKILTDFLSQHYDAVKTAHPQEARRKWQLRVLDQFWAGNPVPPSNSASLEEIEASNEDEDPFDSVTWNVAGGVVLRTDYSDEEAWQSFQLRLKEAQKELTGDEEPQAGSSSTPGASVNETKAAEDEEEEEEEEEGMIIKVVNPEIQEERALFDNISNLTALRLFNDVDIRPSPPLPPDTKKRISPPHRLIDHFGWQEIYTGNTLWIYDKKSNTDKSVRLVSLEGDVYGTATGDSWRAQVSHIYELQLNMLTGMKINFGGMDRWDYNERKRNLDEALVPIA
ncbi:hypothetical protein PQX77_007773 [Marasmius sp. AFHP31]|nr:hypothetical protein PQX77_011766 [Marasmius sp. AFHP31]KAK1229201.1 hypothetical protein PQX77_007773 [Marasmius sp. AFHP31]